MFEHPVSLGSGQRMLGESREQVRVWVIDGGRYGLQPFADDFGDILHFQLLANSF
jgi:hypothetical protein